MIKKNENSTEKLHFSAVFIRTPVPCSGVCLITYPGSPGCPGGPAIPGDPDFPGSPLWPRLPGNPISPVSPFSPFWGPRPPCHSAPINSNNRPVIAHNNQPLSSSVQSSEMNTHYVVCLILTKGNVKSTVCGSGRTLLKETCTEKNSYHLQIHFRT